MPDVYHILIKNKGVFSNVASAAAKAKLRLLYECAPIALLIEAAGGARCVEGRERAPNSCICFCIDTWQEQKSPHGVDSTGSKTPRCAVVYFDRSIVISAFFFSFCTQRCARVNRLHTPERVKNSPPSGTGVQVVVHLPR